MSETAIASPEEPEEPDQGDIYDPDDERVVSIGPDPRSYLEVRASRLVVDGRVQRDANHARVDYIRYHWNWFLSETPTVAPMAGKDTFRVVEGQHRVLALQRVDPELLVWVAILPSSVTPQEQARIGHDISKGRLLHNPFELWQQRLKVMEPHEVLATRELDQRGVNLARSAGPFAIACVGTVSKIVHGGGHTPEYGSKLIGDTVETIIQAFPRYDKESSVTRWDQLIIRVIASILDKYQDQIDRDRLVRKLSNRPAKVWRSAATSHVGPNSTFETLKGFVMSDYNSGLRSGKLEP
jgi:hypothetical protein